MLIRSLIVGAIVLGVGCTETPVGEGVTKPKASLTIMEMPSEANTVSSAKAEIIEVPLGTPGAVDARPIKDIPLYITSNVVLKPQRSAFEKIAVFRVKTVEETTIEKLRMYVGEGMTDLRLADASGEILSKATDGTFGNLSLMIPAGATREYALYANTENVVSERVYRPVIDRIIYGTSNAVTYLETLGLQAYSFK